MKLTITIPDTNKITPRAKKLIEELFEELKKKHGPIDKFVKKEIPLPKPKHFDKVEKGI